MIMSWNKWHFQLNERLAHFAEQVWKFKSVKWSNLKHHNCEVTHNSYKESLCIAIIAITIRVLTSENNFLVNLSLSGWVFFFWQLSFMSVWSDSLAWSLSSAECFCLLIDTSREIISLAKHFLLHYQNISITFSEYIPNNTSFSVNLLCEWGRGQSQQGATGKWQHKISSVTLFTVLSLSMKKSCDCITLCEFSK